MSKTFYVRENWVADMPVKDTMHQVGKMAEKMAQQFKTEYFLAYFCELMGRGEYTKINRNLFSFICSNVYKEHYDQILTELENSPLIDKEYIHDVLNSHFRQHRKYVRYEDVNEEYFEDDEEGCEECEDEEGCEDEDEEGYEDEECEDEGCEDEECEDDEKDCKRRRECEEGEEEYEGYEEDEE